jgi:energy-coupling factor transporter ATPase
VSILIEVDNLSYRHPNLEEKAEPALSRVNLRIAEGEFVALVGANGSGKTTLARHFNALLIPTSGTVRVNGLDTRQTGNHRAIRALVGMVFQSPEDQIVGMTVEEDVAFGPENLGIAPGEIRNRVEAALASVDLQDFRQRPPDQLSAGQMQRVALAGILAMRPRCILFDEATSMLDPKGRHEVVNLMRQLHREGLTILFITHLMEEAAEADRMIVLNHGQVGFDGPPSQIFFDQAALDRFGLEMPRGALLAEELRHYIPGLPNQLLTSEQLISSLPRWKGTSQSTRRSTNVVTETNPDLTLNRPGADPMIEVIDLGYTYLRNTPFARRALNKVSMMAAVQSSHGLIGATGSGKSTLLQHLNGLLRPQEGSVRVGTFHLNDRKVALRTVCQFVGLAFQIPETQFFEQYVGDEISFGPRQIGMRVGLADPVRRAMEWVGLDFERFKDRMTFTLSGGEKRKVALASVLALMPKILLLDEPLAGLDPAARRELLGKFKAMHTSGMTLVVSSHVMEDLAYLVENVSVLIDGKDLLCGRVEQVLSAAAELKSAGLEMPLAAQAASRLREQGWALSEGLISNKALCASLAGSGSPDE